MATSSYTAIIERDGDLYVALCPELDIASQGTTIEDAKANLKEAVELFLECADADEVRRRTHSGRPVANIGGCRSAPGLGDGMAPSMTITAIEFI